MFCEPRGQGFLVQDVDSNTPEAFIECIVSLGDYSGAFKAQGKILDQESSKSL